MKNVDPEMYLNETYYIEVTRNGENITPRVYFHKLTGNFVGFPYPKDNAIRSFIRGKNDYIRAGATVELWRETPELVCCIRADANRISVMPDQLASV